MYSGNKIFIGLLSLSLTLSIGSCVEPVVPELDENDTQGILVVDGIVTDQEGPFIVRLSTSIPVNALYTNNPVLYADVRIFDNAGNSYNLYGDQYGVYKTEDQTLRGIPGRSYTLSVTTPDGLQYESSSVLMQEAPEIDSLWFEEVTHTRLLENTPTEEKWLNIRLDSHDPAGMTRYWYFSFEETWEIRLPAENVPVEHSSPGSPSNITREIISADPAKLVCWVTKPSSSVLIASTVNSSEDRIKNFPLNSIGPGTDKLHIRYSLLARQSAISREQYEFLKQLRDINENSGGMFDQMPGRLFGNISCCGSGSGSSALGYFSAMQVHEKRIFVDNIEHHVETVSAYHGCLYYSFMHPMVPNYYFGDISGGGGEIYSSTEYCSDCRDYGTNVKPDFW